MRIRNLKALATTYPSPFSLLSPVPEHPPRARPGVGVPASQHGGQWLFLNTSTKAVESPWLVTACMPCVWCPDLRCHRAEDAGAWGLAERALLRPVLYSRPCRAPPAVSWWLELWIAHRSVRDMPVWSFSRLRSPFQLCSSQQKNNFWLSRFFFTVYLLFISLMSVLFNFLLISLGLFV